MTTAPLPLSSELPAITELAQSALPLWDLPRGATVRLINVSENTTFMVEAGGVDLAVLRVHRRGYHSRAAILSELAWLGALRDSGAVTAPGVVPGRDGALVQDATGAIGSRFLVLFERLPGVEPAPDANLVPGFETLGAIAARCHAHAISWPRPESFVRRAWDLDAVFGPVPTWGDWRDAPGVTAQIRSVLTKVEARIRDRLTAYGQAPERYNLIHADMRLANLLVSPEGTALIDFDDCGQGWLIYDFAAAVSFIEDDPRLPDLKAAWLRGYRRVRPLPDADAAELDTVVMLRRMALLAWIGSHIEAPEPQAMAPRFAAVTAQLGRIWLKDNS